MLIVCLQACIHLIKKADQIQEGEPRKITPRFFKFFQFFFEITLKLPQVKQEDQQHTGVRYIFAQRGNGPPHDLITCFY